MKNKNLTEAIEIWNQSAISLVDIRHHLISPEESIDGYSMPASTFLYTCSGRAEVILDDNVYHAERFGLFHGGKGTKLSIHPHDDWLEYYMVLYKVQAISYNQREAGILTEPTSPFLQQYGFTPNNPLLFSEQLRKMYERWKCPTPLNLFYGKFGFYQLVYEIYEELDNGNIHIFEPDIAVMAKRYLDTHYRETVIIREMCTMLGISYSHFHRLFKGQTGRSPQEYLIKTRLKAAMELLEKSPASIREIADYCGFPDEPSFYRHFIKNISLSPSAYRETSQSYMRDYTIGNIVTFPYNEEDQVRPDKLKSEGANFMLKQMKNKSIAAAALALMLFLSACNTGPVNTKEPQAAPSQTIEIQEAEPEAAEPVSEETRMIETVVGDVEIPASPRRIIIPYYDRDLLAFGLKPLALSSNYEGAAGYEELKELEVIESWEQENIMSLNPDLIIWLVADDYEKYASIAPTVIIPSDYTLEERITFMGKIFNQEETAEQILRDFDEKIETAKLQFNEAGILDKTVSIVQDMKTGTYVFGDRNGRGGNLLYNLIGMPAPENVQTQLLETEDTYYLPLSLEVLPDYMGDFILVVDSEEGSQGFQSNNIWDSLPAVQQGRVINLNYGLFFYNDITSYNDQLDYLMEELLNKADTFQ